MLVLSNSCYSLKNSKQDSIYIREKLSCYQTTQLELTQKQVSSSADRQRPLLSHSNDERDAMLLTITGNQASGN